MPAQFDSGFFAHLPAWHQMGNVVDFWPGSWEEARKLADLEWDVRESGVFTPSPAEDGLYLPIPGYKQLVRTDTGSTLSVVKQTYGTITVADMGPIVEAIMDQTNVRYETTVVLDGGRRVAAVLRLDEPQRVKGDPSEIYPYAAILNTFDGSGACKAIKTTVRIVCANTFSSADAEANASGMTYSFRHTTGWRDRVQEAKDALRGVRADTAAWIDVANALSLLKVNDAGAMKFWAEFVPMPPEGVVSDRVAKNVTEARAAIKACYESDTCDGVRGTAYGLVQAAGEYLDHLRRANSKSTLMGRQLLRPEPMKARAVALARSAAGA